MKELFTMSRITESLQRLPILTPPRLQHVRLKEVVSRSKKCLFSKDVPASKLPYNHTQSVFQPMRQIGADTPRESLAIVEERSTMTSCWSDTQANTTQSRTLGEVNGGREVSSDWLLEIPAESAMILLRGSIDQAIRHIINSLESIISIKLKTKVSFFAFFFFLGEISYYFCNIIKTKLFIKNIENHARNIS